MALPSWGGKKKPEKRETDTQLVLISILLPITTSVSELMTISAHPRCKAHVYQVVLARDGKRKPPLPAHSLIRLSCNLLEMNAISTTSPDHRFNGREGKLLDWQLFPFPLLNSSTTSPAWQTVTGLHPVLTLCLSSTAKEEP